MSQVPADAVEYDEHENDEPVVETGEPHERSLAARMERHRFAQAGTETFAVPGWRGVLAVELRYTGYRANRVIGRRHERMRDATQQEIRVACDQIISATVGLYEVRGEKVVLQDGESWLSLARKVLKTDLAPDARERGAMLALLAASRKGSTGDLEVMALYGEWMDWMTGVGEQVDEELERDFQETRS